MTLLPRSLLGRMMLIFTVAIIITGTVVTYMSVWNSEKAFSEVRQHYLIQRMIDDINLFNVLNPKQRQEVALLQSKSHYTVTLNATPYPLKQTEETYPEEMAFYDELLKNELGEKPFFISIEKIKSGHKNQEIIDLQAQLHDGQWLHLKRKAHFGNPRIYTIIFWPLILSVLLVVLAITLYAVRWINKPLQKLAKTALAFGKTIHAEPMEITGPLEIQQAAIAFNQMQRQLKQYIEERTRLFAAISHDLKTPLTRMRLRTEFLEDETLRNKFNQDIHELEQLVNAALDYLRSNQEGEKARLVDLNHVLLGLKANFDDMGMLMNYTSTHGSTLMLQPFAIKRALSNIIENAIRYGHCANVSLYEDEQQVSIIVKDEGPGIAPEELKKIFQPFYRIEDSRNKETGGHGLGLTIAQALIKRQGGEIQMDSTPQKGTTVCIVFPKN